MLYRSGENLLIKVKEFILKSEEIKVFSPFIRKNKLEEIIGNSKCTLIVVRWRADDIIQNVTDFEELYEFCKTSNIKLFRNTDIHLKAIVNDREEVFFGSANITNKGMGVENYNLELSGEINSISFNDRKYFDSIEHASDLVDENYFNKFKKYVEEIQNAYKKAPKVPEFQIEDDMKKMFLISALPMSLSPKILWEVYNSKKKEEFSSLEIACASHDLINYKIKNNLTEIEFNNYLKEQFNNHLFIIKLKDAIKSKINHYLGFTELTKWIGDNTTTVPNPRRWEIRDANKVRILHNWICDFDREFESEIKHPNGSDKIHYIGKKSTSIKDIVKELKRDKARGETAPHQIILIAAIFRIVKVYQSNQIELEELKMIFDEIWDNNSERFKTNNKNIGMPIKALERLGLIFLKKNENLNDYRNFNELKENIDSIEVSKSLVEAFDSDCNESIILANLFS